MPGIWSLGPLPVHMLDCSVCQTALPVRNLSRAPASIGVFVLSMSVRLVPVVQSLCVWFLFVTYDNVCLSRISLFITDVDCSVRVQMITEVISVEYIASVSHTCRLNLTHFKVLKVSISSLTMYTALDEN